MKKIYWIMLIAALLVPFTCAESQQPTEAAATSAAAAVVPVDQQATKEQIARLFEVMRIREQLNTTMKAIPQIIQQQLQSQMANMEAKLPEGSRATPEQQAKMNELLSKYLQRASTMYTPDEIVADIAGIYQRHMSKADTDAYIAFYTSPAGQHLLDAQPAIMQEYMPMVMRRVQSDSQKLNEEMQKDIEDLIKSSSSTGANPAQN